MLRKQLRELCFNSARSRTVGRGKMLASCWQYVADVLLAYWDRNEVFWSAALEQQMLMGIREIVDNQRQ